MARVHLLTVDNAPAEAKPVLEELVKAFKRVPNIFAAMAHTPSLLDGILKVDSATTTSLPAPLRELAYMRTSAINGCEY